jgi:hypothetical protein
MITMSDANFRTIAEIKSANAALGQTWFAPAEMRWFGSRVLDGVIGGRFFITSERPPASTEPRAYTVREAHPSGTISTVGDFMGHRTAAQARAAAKYALALQTAPVES